MTETIPTDPQLSSDFDRARTFSRGLAGLFTIGTVGTGVVLAIAIPVSLWPESLMLFKQAIHGVAPDMPEIPMWGRLGAVVASVAVLVPILLSFWNASRVFTNFTKGEVFSAATIGHIRTTAMWLIVAGVIPPRPSLLIVGVATYVAAYVMAEARRIADDNASIV